MRSGHALSQGFHSPKDPPVLKTLRIVNLLSVVKFATAIVKHYGGHFETTMFKGKLSSKLLQIVKKLQQ